MNIDDLDREMLAREAPSYPSVPFAPALADFAAGRISAAEAAAAVASAAETGWQRAFAERSRNEMLGAILEVLAEAVRPKSPKQLECEAAAEARWQRLREKGGDALEAMPMLSPEERAAQDAGGALAHSREALMYCYRCTDEARALAYALYFALCAEAKIESPMREVWEIVRASPEAAALTDEISMNVMSWPDYTARLQGLALPLAVRLMGDYVADPDRPLSPYTEHEEWPDTPAAALVRARFAALTQYGEVFGFAAHRGGVLDRSRANLLQGYALQSAMQLFRGSIDRNGRSTHPYPHIRPRQERVDDAMAEASLLMTEGDRALVRSKDGKARVVSAYKPPRLR